MIEVAALTSGRNVPSARFRVRQHIPGLAHEGIFVHEYVPLFSKYYRPSLLPDGLWKYATMATRVPGVFGSRRSQITWLERPLVQYRKTLEKYLGTPLVFDVDDAVWVINERPIELIARMADIGIAGNDMIANWLTQFIEKVHIIPTAINTERFKPADATEKQNDVFTIGWTGTESTLPYLLSIENALKRFLDTCKEAQLLIIADRPPRFLTINPDRVRFIQWAPQNEAISVSHMDIGLMPLPDNVWTRGKCSFKMLQYMSCGVSTVVSPVGMNNQVMAKGQVGLSATDETDWYEALVRLYEDDPFRQQCGHEGRAVVEQYYSQKVVGSQLATVFKDLA